MEIKFRICRARILGESEGSAFVANTQVRFSAKGSDASAARLVFASVDADLSAARRASTPFLYVLDPLVEQRAQAL